jgi:hypothetical protein
MDDDASIMIYSKDIEKDLPTRETEDHSRI